VTHPAGSVAIVVRDLSTTGLLFESQAPSAIGERLRIELPQAVSAAAKIVWQNACSYGCELEASLSRGAVSAALLKGEPQARLDEQSGGAGAADRWPKPTRLGLIVGGSALLWAMIALAVGVLR